jgi:hypothetical protein
VEDEKEADISGAPTPQPQRRSTRIANTQDERLAKALQQKEYTRALKNANRQYDTANMAEEPNNNNNQRKFNMTSMDSTKQWGVTARRTLHWRSLLQARSLMY